jgi:cytoskeletal protein RodZ
MIALGQRLIHARKVKKITLEQAAKQLRIRTEFLDALENGEYQKLPSSAYAIGFVGNYAEYLGLPKAETVAMFRREYDEKRVYSVLPEEFTKTKEFKVKRVHFNQTLSIFTLIALCTIGYLLFQYRFAFLNPTLDVYTPSENVVVNSGEVMITGRSDPNSTVLINNTVVSVDQNGNFSKQLDLFEGKTVIQISAVNRFGKKNTIERHIDVKTQY